MVHSWRRLFDPGRIRRPLASLVADVRGARDLLAGRTSDVTSLGVRADGDRTVVVDLERGGGDLPAIVSGAPFAVVPPSVGDGEIQLTTGGLVGSGGYLLSSVEPDAIVLTANPRYWAGKPAIETVRMLNSTGGRSTVDLFVGGRRGRGADRVPGRRLDRLRPRTSARRCAATRRCPSPTTASTRPGRRSTTPASGRPSPGRWTGGAWRGSTTPARPCRRPGWCPRGCPAARRATTCRPYDPEGARELLAEAGYPGGAGLPADLVHRERGRLLGRRGRDAQGEPGRHDRLRDDGLPGVPGAA